MGLIVWALRAQKYLCSGSHSDKGARSSSSLRRRGFPRLLKQQLLFTFPSNVNHRRRCRCHRRLPSPPPRSWSCSSPAARRTNLPTTARAHKTSWHVLPHICACRSATGVETRSLFQSVPCYCIVLCVIFGGNLVLATGVCWIKKKKKERCESLSPRSSGFDLGWVNFLTHRKTILQ